MKIACVYLPKGTCLNGIRAETLISAFVEPGTQNSTTPFLLYEAPIRSMQFVAFVMSPYEGGTGADFAATIVDLTQFLPETKIGEDGIILPGSEMLDNPLKEFALVLQNAAKDFQPFFKSGAPYKEVTNTWVNQPKVFDEHVDGRKNPGELAQQNSFIILAWRTWDKNKASIKDRAADMERQGFGTLAPRALEKRAKRLGLSNK